MHSINLSDGPHLRMKQNTERMSCKHGTCRGTSEMRCCSAWLQKSTYPKLTENTTADVVVVGAGLTGAILSRPFL